MRIFLFLLLMIQPALADVVVPTRTIRPNSVIMAEDVTIVGGEMANAFDRLEDVVGQEARVALYKGRPVYLDSIGPPALVDRNDIVLMRFAKDGLVITTDGRALERGGVGDRVRIMNLNSRATLFGFVQADGSVSVKP
jgi:flagella basal body P-ring formation protein FlgA